MVDKSADKIRGMFNGLAPCYDTMNRLMTFQQDRLWRRKLARMALSEAPRPARMLDLCTGTGDLALAIARMARQGDSIVAVDFAESLLDLAREKARSLRNGAPRPEFISADALETPFEDSSFDAVSIGFGVRNFENLEKGLREIHRVLRPDGKLYALETSNCETPVLRHVATFYTRHIMPVIGRIVSGGKAYDYLRDSAEEFPDRREFAGILENCGFTDIRVAPLSLGAVTIYSGKAEK